METLRLLTFNTLFRGRARARLRALGGVLEGTGAPECGGPAEGDGPPGSGDRLEDGGYDLVCLQEVMWARNLAALRAATPSYRHAGHAPAWPLVRGGLATLSTLPLVRREFRLFPPMAPLRREWSMLKGVLVTHHRLGELPVTVLNTHLAANRDDDWSPDNPYTRVETAQLALLERLVHAQDPGALLLVAGDFNVPRTSAPYRAFVAASGLHDVLAEDREPTYRPTARWPNPPAIDQVLLRRPAGLAVAATARLVLRDKMQLADGTREFLSDHVGIAVTLQLEN